MIIFVFLLLLAQNNSNQVLVERIITEKLKADFQLVFEKDLLDIEIDGSEALVLRQQCEEQELLGFNLSELKVQGRPGLASELYQGGSAGPEYIFYLVANGKAKVVYQGNIIGLSTNNRSGCTPVVAVLHGSHFNRAGNLYGERQIIHFGAN